MRYSMTLHVIDVPPRLFWVAISTFAFRSLICVPVDLPFPKQSVYELWYRRGLQLPNCMLKFSNILDCVRMFITIKEISTFLVLLHVLSITLVDLLLFTCLRLMALCLSNPRNLLSGWHLRLCVEGNLFGCVLQTRRAEGVHFTAVILV